MNKTKRNELIDELKPIVLGLSITAVVDSRLNGSRLSPFRDDKHEGSFAISEAHGCCTDFVEGVTRNNITFIKDYDGVDFQEAVLRLAYEFGIIDEKTYKENSFNQTKREVKKTIINTKKGIKQATKKPEEFLNLVYGLMKNYCGLSKEHYDYLVGRGVENPIGKYFTYTNKGIGYYIWELQRLGYKADDLLGVPGFYKKNKSIELKDIEGIGIPMINAKGNITAIQLRRDKVEEGEPRYIFLSSTGLYEGCTCGSQVTCERLWIDGDVYITEGQFKALGMSKYFNSTVLSVQGVNNIKCLETEIPNLLKRQRIKRFVIAFDADMIHNKSVLKATKKLARLLSTYEIPVVYLLWDEKYGKGADDVILAGNGNRFTYSENLENL